VSEDEAAALCRKHGAVAIFSVRRESLWPLIEVLEQNLPLSFAKLTNEGSFGISSLKFKAEARPSHGSP